MDKFPAGQAGLEALVGWRGVDNLWISVTVPLGGRGSWPAQPALTSRRLVGYYWRVKGANCQGIPRVAGVFTLVGGRGVGVSGRSGMGWAGGLAGGSSRHGVALSSGRVAGGGGLQIVV